jgi:hypothetical protein
MQLTEDHRLVLSAEESYLGRALGAGGRVEIDHASVRTEPGVVGMSDDFAGSRAQIGSMARDQASDRLRIDVLVHAVGGPISAGHSARADAWRSTMPACGPSPATSSS